MSGEQVGFWVVALAILGAGRQVVTSRNLVHTVLWLAVTLANTAVAFVMLEATFLAAVQVLLYTGGVLTLMLFGVMLTTRDTGFVDVRSPLHRGFAGGVLAAAVMALVSASILRTPLPEARVTAPTTEALGASFLTEHVLAFEALSLLLLSAVIGAVVIARRRDAGDPREERGPAIRPRAPRAAGGAVRLGAPEAE
ncbi:MAG: NADH-quinone oxidoreductase subunit J [Polyangiaceae bacterium]|nr:NADH-quinone oxidoreductase subunit J [Polyangiaceae bacterium]